MRALYLDTLWALAAPRRAVPIGVLAGALLAAQAWFAADAAGSVSGVIAVVGFLATSPFLWRVWMVSAGPSPSGSPEPLAARATRFRSTAAVLLALLAAAPLLALLLLPRAGVGRATFLSDGLNGLVVGALFWVGGWGLARDIELEAGLARQKARADLLARQAEQAQLLALRAHLDPHFLFNTLNAIAAWCAEDPAVAEAALLRLAALLRTVMEGTRVDAWPLARELALARDVAALYATRDPERFRLVEAPGEVPDVDVPPLLLLPMIENAYTHGPGAGHAGPVTLAVRRVGDAVVVTIRNPGAFRGRRPGGEGLALLEKRAALAGGTFSIRADGGETEAVLALAGG